MYIDVGGDFSLRRDTVVGVFDLDNTSCSKWTRQFLQKAQQEGQIVETTDDLPKSFVVSTEFGQTRVYLTRYNAAILQKRLEEAEKPVFQSQKGVYPYE